MTPRSITLGDASFAVLPPTLGVLRKLLPTFNRLSIVFATGEFREDAFDDIVAILCAATGEKAETFESIPLQFTDVVNAIEVIADVAGLKPKEGAEGNRVATGSIGTSSTAT